MLKNWPVIALMCLSTSVLANTMPACSSPATVLDSHINQATRIFQRITGVPPKADQLSQMAEALACEDANFAQHAVAIALEDKHFYNVTLKNWVTPWTNEEQTVFADLNDYTATVIGMVANNKDFREVLYGNYVYKGHNVPGLPEYSPDNNHHYVHLENSGVSLKDHLVQSEQSLPTEARAGVMTTRAAAKAFFIDGTNRAMLRFTLMNHLCRDLEQLNDPTRSPDRVRQDVSRSPGGDSRIFLNSCVGCHAGMDPLAQAYAYYQYQYDVDNDPDAQYGQIVYTQGQVQAKYLINANNFIHGFATPDDQWSNYWREGVNAHLGWSGELSGKGVGAKSMGMELAHSTAFAQCQVEKVFRAVCLRQAANANDKAQVQNMLNRFQQTHNYRIKPVFGDAALYCKGETL